MKFKALVLEQLDMLMLRGDESCHPFANEPFANESIASKPRLHRSGSNAKRRSDVSRCVFKFV